MCLIAPALEIGRYIFQHTCNTQVFQVVKSYMPELPEVEIVKRGLEKALSPKVTITKVKFHRRNLRNILPVKNKKLIINQRILKISRRAKYILIEFDEAVLVSHLGMTGTWRVEKGENQFKDHDHIVMHLSNGQKLIYNDPRRFGIFDIVSSDKIEQYKPLAKLGPEPLSKSFSADYLFNKSRKRQVPIKTFLMDQTTVVGVGNIYACEVLFLAGISPHLKASQLTRTMSERLVRYIKEVLQKAINLGGSSINDYYSVDEEPGSYQDLHFVYGRKSQSCRKCSELIQVEVISGRSTFWCVHCQKGPRVDHERSKNSTVRKSLSSAARAQRSRRQHRQTQR